jgi:hypothetical protein
MKRYIFLLLIPVVLYVFWSKEEKEVSLPTPELSRATPKKVLKNKEVFYGKRKSSVAVNETDGCDVIRHRLDGLDFNLDIEDWIAEVRTLNLSACTHPDFAEKIKEIQKLCLVEKPDKEYCLVNLVFLRGQMRAKFIKNPSTREELADMITSEFSKKNPDFKKLRQLARKLMDQDPNDLAVQKVWALTSVVSEGDPTKMSDNLVNEIYSNLGPELFAEDKQMRSLDVMLKTKLRPDSVEEMTRKIMQEDPKDLTSRELLGWSLWQQGKREEAIAQVDYILSQTNDPWLRDMRQKLLDPNANKESYAGRINIGVRLEDLWN